MLDTGLEKRAAHVFKYFNKFMLLMWRLGLAKFINFSPKYIGRIMVITHVGRKSGLRRQTPVNYTLIDEQIYCTAGFGRTSDWYRNILANPQVEVWLPEGWWAGQAEEILEPKQRLPLLRSVLIDSGFAAYAAGVDPIKMSDAELEKATASYRLLRIRRIAACTGPNGPNDLSWVWPLATFILIPLAIFRRRR